MNLRTRTRQRRHGSTRDSYQSYGSGGERDCFESTRNPRNVRKDRCQDDTATVHSQCMNQNEEICQLKDQLREARSAAKQSLEQIKGEIQMLKQQIPRERQQLQSAITALVTQKSVLQSESTCKIQEILQGHRSELENRRLQSKQEQDITRQEIERLKQLVGRSASSLCNVLQNIAHKARIEGIDLTADVHHRDQYDNF